MLRLLKFLLLSTLVLSGCRFNNKEKTAEPIKIEGLLPKIQLVDLDNKIVRLDEYKGKTIFINFWATWCKPCIEEMPSIEKAQSIMKSKEIVFLLASSEGIDEIKEFSKNHSYQFRYVHLENGETLNLQALPTTFIINPMGNLVFSEMGSRNWGESDNINLIKKITQQHD
ncbi:MAG: TlpA family protein disulfide reductase [Chitinophagaceae bacterium]|jgi:thiol-disulfide isomerase/thioredoxin|nr:MAG: TlpA family protein disulfide reductase [Chitinophagaceae bacterium]